jgi:hypothetical protein
MSDQPGTESFEDDLGSYSIDDSVDAGESQADELLDTSEGDNEPWSPPDQQSRATEWGTTASEQSQEETIEQRIRQEVPDPDSAYGAPDDEGGLDHGDLAVHHGASAYDELGEEDEADEFLDDGEVGSGEGGEGGPESAAMHVIEE